MSHVITMNLSLVLKVMELVSWRSEHVYISAVRNGLRGFKNLVAKLIYRLPERGGSLFSDAFLHLLAVFHAHYFFLYSSSKTTPGHLQDYGK